jgi:nicotinamidase-related amidase
MTKSNALRFGAVSENTIHLCVDMQRMFAGPTDWQMPWLSRVLPNIIAISEVRPSHTIFTRFIPAKEPGAGLGMWKHYYERWHMMTIDRLGQGLIDLVPELARFVPPSRVFDKYVYSPWTGSTLHLDLQNAGIDTLIITGGETDV